ncbi:uncharacterized protein LOC111135098 isoform X2 [Crassostrea virginica]
MLKAKRKLLSKMRRRKKSLTIHFFSNMSEISEETEELLLAEDRISERSSISNSSKETEKEKRKSEEETHKVKAESDTDQSELSSDDDTSNSPTGKRKYKEEDVLEEQSVNPLIDKAEDSGDPLSQMEMTQFNDDSLEPCPPPCSNAPREKNNRYEVLVNCTVASDQLGLSGRFCLHLKAKSLDLEDCDTQDTVHSWKYRHIQKFGYNKSTNDFLMVTRRRNKFGHGVFDFHVMGDPRKIIDSLQDKSGCSLRLADNANRISNLT